MDGVNCPLKWSYPKITPRGKHASKLKILHFPWLKSMEEGHCVDKWFGIAATH